MYHLELRQFPHNLCRFNLTDAQLRAITASWARGERVQLGERSWDPHQARLTVLEGPEIPAGNLTMGRGWRHAQRHGHDVTARELAAAPRARAGSPAGVPLGAAGTPHSEMLGLLGAQPAALLAHWKRAAERHPERSPSELLALAERELDASGASSRRRSPAAGPGSSS